MKFLDKLKHEIKSVVLVTLFFAAWLSVFMAIKMLILEDYDIPFKGFSMALVGALILGKVVLILEHVSLGTWVRHQPVLVEVLLRTLLYAFGTLVVLLLERSFESRHEHGGVVPALANVFEHRDMPYVWVNTICLGGALLFYNLFSALKSHLGKDGLARVFLTPPNEPSGR